MGRPGSARLGVKALLYVRSLNTTAWQGGPSAIPVFRWGHWSLGSKDILLRPAWSLHPRLGMHIGPSQAPQSLSGTSVLSLARNAAPLCPRSPSVSTEPSFPSTEAAGAGPEGVWPHAEGSKEQNHLLTPAGSSTHSCCF